MILKIFQFFRKILTTFLSYFLPIDKSCSDINFKYDISIIIPVYNNEKYIDECIHSILNQKFDINRIEIILIDDESVDNSYKICQKYAEKYNNIKLLTQKHAGVSCARNAGMKIASGKYILFLDSDDYISANACKNIFNMFEKHFDEIDIITYPIIYNRNNRFGVHYRYAKLYYNGSAIYDLTKDYKLIQTTINICIKNNFENNSLFNAKQNFSEDEDFATRIIMGKQKIGFCKEATYYYRLHTNQANNTITNSYYTFEIITNYYETLFKQYSVNGKVPAYIQSLYLNNLRWRINQDDLFPYYLENNDFNKALDRIKKLISKIDIQVIMNFINMDFYHKIFLLNLSDRKLDYKFEDNVLNIYSDNEFIKDFKELEGIIHRIKLRNNKLYLMGSLLNPIFSIIKPVLYIEKRYANRTEIEEIDTFISNNSYYGANFKTTVSYGFDYVLDVDHLNAFKLFIKIDNHKLDISFSFSRFASNNFICDHKNILYSPKELCFKIRNKNIVTLLKSRIRNFITIFPNSRRAFVYSRIYRILYYFTFKKNVWIYTDRGDALDNAYTQFIHDFNIKDGIKRYYIARFNKDELNKYFTKEQQKYVIKQCSLKHKMLFGHSKKVISSFIDLQVYCPFDNAIIFYKDLLHYELIYLQHGILHANLLKMYAKEFTEIDQFVISTTFEQENLINKYHYKAEDLLYTGMPRIKMIHSSTETKNRILFAPSWRRYLIGDLYNNKRDLKVTEFINSKFYKEISNFLSMHELSELLKENDFTLEFKLHPIFKEYLKCFKINSSYITIACDNINIEEYKIFITDFSSFQFDFVRLKRPIIYFMPDMIEFKAGLHTYRELDLKYEDAFGTLCLDSKDVIKELKESIKNNSIPDTKYLKRMDSFFLNIKDPTDDIYNSLKNN